MSTTITLVKRLLNTEAGRRRPLGVISRLAGWQLWRWSLRRPSGFSTVTGPREVRPHTTKPDPFTWHAAPVGFFHGDRTARSPTTHHKARPLHLARRPARGGAALLSAGDVGALRQRVARIAYDRRGRASGAALAGTGGSLSHEIMSTTITLVKRLLDTEAGRRRPLGVISRLASWQLWRRSLRRPLGFSTVTGSRLILLPGASESLAGFWYEQIPDFEELTFALHCLRPGELFVDVGANQGGWTLLLAGWGARAIAFEPVPLTRERLLANLAANPPAVRDRVQVLPLGLSDEAGQVRFTANLDVGNHRVHDAAADSKAVITVELAKADDVLRAEDPTLIKIDVEGEELGVLKGAREVLSKRSLKAVVMETFRPSNFATSALIGCEAILREHDFLPVAYDPWKRELSPLLQPSDGGQNTIYVRDVAEVASRIKQSAPLHAFGATI